MPTASNAEQPQRNPDPNEAATIADDSAQAAVPAANNPLPKLIAKRYQMDGVIGAGGMGAVYRALDTEKKTYVAIKQLAQRHNVGDTTISTLPRGRFRREFNVMMRLHHPNVVEFIDFGWLDTGEPYLVMELVQGTTLSTLLRSRTEELLPQDTALEKCVLIWLQLCDALGFIHQNGLVHRDVKPANLMLVGNPFAAEKFTLKLMDFGLARFEDSMALTEAGSMIGTAIYISPEQAQGNAIDLRTDLYALGVIMYEMVTGRPPFMADTPLAIVRMHLDATPLAPKFINPALPNYLNELILRLLAKEPEQRLSSAEEVALALRTKRLPAQRDEAANPLTRPQLVGRNATLRQLQDVCSAAWASNRAHALVVYGEIGMGKTALLGELGNWARRRNATVLRGVCSETGRMPYGAVAESLSTHLISRKQDTTRDDLLKDIRTEIGRIIPELAPGRVSLDEAAAQTQMRLFSAVSQLVSRIALRKPLFWLIDDAQWLDADALELLGYILRRNSDAPLCVCLAARPEPVFKLELIEAALTRDNVFIETLLPLAEANARKLAGMELGKQSSPNAIDFIVSRSDGNPLFIQELAHTLKAERPTPEAIASVNDTLSLPVPVRIERVMANRLGELGKTERDVLNWAAVYGRDFDVDILAGAIGEQADEIADVVDELLKRKLLQERRTARSETYRFTHQQLREVVYGELSTRRKRNMHSAVAQAMEHAGSVPPAELETQFAESGNDTKAIEYGLLAGERAREAFAQQDALRFYQRVLDRTKQRTEFELQTANAHLGLGETYSFLGNYPKARAAYEQVLAFAR